jgi:hypothetical protein
MTTMKINRNKDKQEATSYGQNSHQYYHGTKAALKPQKKTGTKEKLATFSNHD